MHPIQHRRLPLALMAALATVAANPAAFAGVVPADGEVVLGPGAPAERWTVGTGGTLIVQPGAQLIDIAMSGAGTLQMDGATVTSSGSYAAMVSGTATISNSSLTNTSREALRVTNLDPSSPDRTTVNISGSTIRSVVNAVSMGSRTDLTLSNISVAGGNVGINSFGGRLSVLGGSRIEGVAAGIRLRVGDISMDTPGENVIDGSTVEGLAGPAISVLGTSSGGASAETRIAVRNGSQLIGGNGNLLEVSTTGTDLPIAHFDVQSSALRGNIVVGDDGSQGHVTLSNGGSITGAFTNVTSATLDNGGHWQMSGDSSVGTLALNDGGTLALGDGGTFNTLSVDTFTGNGGTVLFNTVLGADGSNTDLLHVLGDTSGTAKVAIDQRAVQRQGDALGDGDRQPHPRERARAAAQCDRIQLRTGHPRLGQQRLGPGQAEFGVAARRDLEALSDLPIHIQGDGAGFGGGFKGEQFHGGQNREVGKSSVGGTARADGAATGAGAGGAPRTGHCGAKKACTSASERVRRNGGSESRKIRP